MQQSITIQKHPALPPGSDYYLLRQKGIEYIQNLGSQFWTDYNVHDPGITILEALCYALTDLGYRTSLDIKDLLATPAVADTQSDRQGFFTARNILTVNPWTINDYRKLLIDIDGVKNGWLHCKACPCDGIYLYANCPKSKLQYVPTINPVVPVIIRGLYDVLIEFEDEEKTGNLNSGKIFYRFNFATGDGFATANIEMRLPSWYDLEQNKASYRDFRKPTSTVTEVKNITIAKTKHGTGIPVADIVLDSNNNALRKPVYVTLDVDFNPGTGTTQTLHLEDVPMSLWFSSSNDRKSLQSLPALKEVIADNTRSGILPKYLAKIKRADEVMATTAALLHDRRNLAEDYCTIQAIQVEDIAVCADMEVEPDADIEAVLAEAYYCIDQYFSADIKFYSLKELYDGGKPVDEIFEGPVLHNGFIDDAQLESTNLKKVLYVSDIINLLMDILGVRAVKNFVLTRYDRDGNIAMKRDSHGNLVGDIESWSMEVTYNHQPRLYIEASKVLVFKNGLPFLPDNFELSDSLQVIRGKNAQPKYAESQNDFPVPAGRYYDLHAYYPVQYSLPQTYGVSEAGLPSTASTMRKAQRKQLQAYLLFFEQLLVNYLQQLSNIKELFAIDKTVVHTYFTGFIGNNLIEGLDGTDGLYNGFSGTGLENMVERPLTSGGPNDPVFLDRRNRFLDHLLARFAEQFNDYALMLYSINSNRQKTDEQLISDKIDFLKRFPSTSANRVRALNYKNAEKVCNKENIAGLQERIELLLNLDDEGYSTYFEIYSEYDSSGTLTDRRWYLVGAPDEVLALTDETELEALEQAAKRDKIYLRGGANYVNLSEEKLSEAVKKDVAKAYKVFTNADRYSAVKTGSKWTLNLLDEEGAIIATGKQTFTTKTAALAERDFIIDFANTVSNREKFFVVEHLLLRPRNGRNPALYFELYEENDTDGVFFERRWRLIDATRRIYLSSSTRYPDPDLAVATAKAKSEIDAVCQHIHNPVRYEVKKEIKWVLNLLDATGEVIATRKQHFETQAAAVAARDEIIKLVDYYGAEGTPINAGQLIHSGNVPEPDVIADGDPLLPVCLSANCGLCSDEDPYSFRVTVVVNGQDGPAGSNMDFRQFAEQTIRLETPAHLGVKICWVSKRQLRWFAAVYCRWRTELAKPEPDKLELHNRLVALLVVFARLKNSYPPATLHDCADGNDENRVFLGRTII